MWLIILSDQLEIVALVSSYLTNKLISPGHILTREARRSPSLARRHYAVLAIVSNGYPPHQGNFPGITHPSAARQQRKQAFFLLPLDLHVLGLPPAFNLSHDQTLQLKFFVAQ